MTESLWSSMSSDNWIGLKLWVYWAKSGHSEQYKIICFSILENIIKHRSFWSSRKWYNILGNQQCQRKQNNARPGQKPENQKSIKREYPVLQWPSYRNPVSQKSSDMNLAAMDSQWSSEEPVSQWQSCEIILKIEKQNFFKVTEVCLLKNTIWP